MNVINNLSLQLARYLTYRHKPMKKLILSIAILVCGITAAMAQTFTVISPDTVYTSGVTSDYEIIVKATIRNNTTNPINVGWKRFVNNLPSGWSASICDITNGCYAPSVDSQTLNLPAGSSTRLDVHFYPNGNLGSGLARVRFGSGTNAKSITYVASSYTVGLNDPAKASFQFYPNPARSTLNVNLSENIKTGNVEIYSVIGTLLLSETITPMDDIIPLSVDHLPRGTYVIRINSPAQGILLSRTFQKF